MTKKKEKKGVSSKIEWREEPMFMVKAGGKLMWIVAGCASNAMPLMD